MNTIGIDRNLDRARIRKLLAIGLFASVMTGVGDFLLGYAEGIPGNDFASGVLAGAPNLTDGQLIAGGLLGFFGIFLEGLAFFAVYRLMADAAPRYAHLYRAGIFGYIWLAPVGCHMNVGVLNMAYKYLLLADGTLAERAARRLFYGFSLPVYSLLVLFWLPMMAVQFQAFAKGLTPYPTKAKWFAVLPGTVPAFVLCWLAGPGTALGAAFGTMFLSFGNAFMFGGLLAALPGQECFEEFEKRVLSAKKWTDKSGSKPL